MTQGKTRKTSRMKSPRPVPTSPLRRYRWSHDRQNGMARDHAAAGGRDGFRIAGQARSRPEEQIGARHGEGALSR